MPADGYINYVLIPHPWEASLLAVPSEEGLSLPPIRTEPTHRWWREVAVLNEAVRRQLHRKTTALRCIDIYARGPDGRCSGIFLMEDHSLSAEAPPGMVWLGRHELEGARFVSHEHRAAIKHWCDNDWRSAGPSRPWNQPGWFGTAVEWIQQQLARQGHTTVGRVEQVRNHSASCLLHLESTRGPLYFKGSSEMFAYEPSLTRMVAEEHPDFAPKVLAVDDERHWMLMEDFAGPKLGQIKDRALYLTLWKTVLRRYAQIQRASAERLSALGCPDWRPQRMAESIGPFLERAAADPLVLPETGAEPVIRQLQELAPGLTALCLDLDQDGLPAALHHGDLQSGNVLTCDTSCRVIDWTFAAVAHPFFTLNIALAEHTDAQHRLEIRDHYLQSWTDYGDFDGLVRIFHVSQPVASLHDAMECHRLLCNAQTTVEVERARGLLLSCLNSALRAMMARKWDGSEHRMSDRAGMQGDESARPRVTALSESLNRTLKAIAARTGYVDLLCLHGSQVAGTAQEDSDIDYYVLLSDEKHRGDLLDAIGEHLPQYGGRETYFEWESSRVSFHILATRSLLHYMRLLTRDVAHFQQYQVWAQGYVCEAVPIFDRRGYFPELDSLGSPDRPAHRSLFAESARQDIENIGLVLQSLDKGVPNVFYFISRLADVNDLILRALYALNGRYYIRRCKRAHHDLGHLQPDVSTEMSFIAVEPNTREKIRQKVEKLRAVYEKLSGTGLLRRSAE